MSNEQFAVNDTVIFRNKTGEYIGKIYELRPNETVVVEVLAVLSHPTQGDLHNPNQIDVPLFHQRRAMSYREKTVIRTQMLSTYNEEIPDYQDSLKSALQRKLEKLNDRDDEWAKASRVQLEDLKKDYFG